MRQLTKLDIAMHYLGAGLCVIPIRPRSKTPPRGFVWRQYQHERPGPADLRDWFDGELIHDIAIIGGKPSGNLAVLDFDGSQEGFEAWRSEYPELAASAPIVRTGRQTFGMHVYVRTQHAVKTQAIARNGLDFLKGTGGYVVAPNSVHLSGRTYKLLSGDFSEIPIVDKVPLPGNLRQDTHSKHIACVTTVEDAIAATLPAGPGQRNRAVFCLARALKGIEGIDTSPGNLRRIVGSGCRGVCMLSEQRTSMRLGRILPSRGSGSSIRAAGDGLSLSRVRVVFRRRRPG